MFNSFLTWLSPTTHQVPLPFKLLKPQEMVIRFPILQENVHTRRTCDISQGFMTLSRDNIGKTLVDLGVCFFHEENPKFWTSSVRESCPSIVFVANEHIVKWNEFPNSIDTKPDPIKPIRLVLLSIKYPTH